MKQICLYFQVHQPFRLKSYRFFDIGTGAGYWDDHKNRNVLEKVAEKCYLRANNVLHDLIREYGSRFKVSFSISGTALDQFEQYAPGVLDSFKALAHTGSVEFLAETHAHSLSSIICPEEFSSQVSSHAARIEEVFGQKPSVFRNTELIYSDEIGDMVFDLGFKGMLAEGAVKTLGWRSPNFVYSNARHPELKLLLKNFRLSDDIAFRFSDQNWSAWPLTADKFTAWLNSIPKEDEIVNLFMDYETFGEHQWDGSGIFEFLRNLPENIFRQGGFEFATPSEAISRLQPVGIVRMEEPVSWADEERDLSAWLGNDIQNDAFQSLYRLKHLVKLCRDPQILKDWNYLQTSDHFYYMCTKYFADGDVHKYFNPYSSPYEAFINYMNVLADFELRLRRHVKALERSRARAGRRLRKSMASAVSQ